VDVYHTSTRGVALVRI